MLTMAMKERRAEENFHGIFKDSRLHRVAEDAEENSAPKMNQSSKK